jgi:translation elongation factor EF-Ts
MSTFGKNLGSQIAITIEIQKWSGISFCIRSVLKELACASDFSSKNLAFSWASKNVVLYALKKLPDAVDTGVS